VIGSPPSSETVRRCRAAHRGLQDRPAVCIEEADNSFRLLERLDESVQKNSRSIDSRIECYPCGARKSVHGNQFGQIPGAYPRERRSVLPAGPFMRWILRAEPLAS
jgi:hypothetical protein